jgi:hypothetical protein
VVAPVVVVPFMAGVVLMAGMIPMGILPSLLSVGVTIVWVGSVGRAVHSLSRFLR